MNVCYPAKADIKENPLNYLLLSAKSGHSGIAQNTSLRQCYYLDRQWNINRLQVAQAAAHSHNLCKFDVKAISLYTISIWWWFWSIWWWFWWWFWWWRRIIIVIQEEIQTNTSTNSQCHQFWINCRPTTVSM